jgi:hypothetical protein
LGTPFGDAASLSAVKTNSRSGIHVRGHNVH